jgi:undecaprenyl-diphosphatase
MTILDALILGVVQGLTEFLPVSSSGHLVIAQKYLGFTTPPVFFDLLVHAATLIAVIGFFYREIITLGRHHLKMIAIGTAPALIIGLLLHSYIHLLLNSILLVAVGLMVTAIQLFSIQRCKRGSNTLSNMTFKQALMVGIFQAIAIIPGISRSGSTVAAGIRAGVKEKAAFQFSFLLSIPVVSGAVIFDYIRGTSSIDPMLMNQYLIGFLAALLTGIVALRLLKWLIVSSKLHYFAWYCATLSLLLFISLLS